MGQGIQEWTKQSLWKTAFNKFEVIIMVCLGRPYDFKSFKSWKLLIIKLPVISNNTGTKKMWWGNQTWIKFLKNLIFQDFISVTLNFLIQNLN